MIQGMSRICSRFVYLKTSTWRRAHQCVAAYLSDFSLLETCLLPLGLPNRDISMLASLDHAIWFHSPFRADEWMLYDMEATRAAGSRALCSGR